MTTAYTANTRAVYRAGAYSGTHSIGALRRHGTFGLGALDRNDGEFVMMDGRAFRTARDGTTTELDDAATTPYAVVLPFQPAATRSLPTSGSKSDFEDELGRTLLTKQHGWAVRIQGSFHHVEAGAGAAQSEPYRPLHELLPEYNWLRHDKTVGTLIGLAMPESFSAIDVLGFHFHWLSDDLRQGGHVVDYAAENVRVDVCNLTTFTFGLARQS